MKLDAHHHFWQFDATEYAWIGPDMTVLRRDFLPGDLRPLLDAAGVDGTVAVQARQTPVETRWLLELAAEFPWIFGVVGWVDLRSDALGAQLDALADQPKLVGVRHVIQDEPDADFATRSDFMRGVGKLAAHGLTYDLLVFPHQLPAATQLVRAFPNQPFVLDHIAKPPIKRGAIDDWAQAVSTLAREPNVWCKVSGMVTEADWYAWQPTDFTPYLDVIFEAFGAHRIMLGSDWPVCLLAGAYDRVLGLARDYIATLSPTERAGVEGDNAAQFYGLG
jgi:L-fuconolactonase